MSDALWIGVDSVGESCVTALNVFRKVGDTFELVRMIEGDEADVLYSKLTKDEEAGHVAEIEL